MWYIFKSQKWVTCWILKYGKGDDKVAVTPTKLLLFIVAFLIIFKDNVWVFSHIKTFAYYERIRKCHFSCFNVISKASSFFMATIVREIYELCLCLVYVCQNWVSMIMEESSMSKRSHINNKRKSWTCLFSFFIAKACVRVNYCWMTIYYVNALS